MFNQNHYFNHFMNDHHQHDVCTMTRTIYRQYPIQSPINIDTRRTTTNPNIIKTEICTIRRTQRIHSHSAKAPFTARLPLTALSITSRYGSCTRTTKCCTARRREIGLCGQRREMVRGMRRRCQSDSRTTM